MNTLVDWPKLIRIPCWTALEEIGCGGVEVREGLFRLGPNCYLTAGRYDAYLRPSASRRIGSLLWAETEGAAVRAVLMEIEADSACPGIKIPPEMLLPEGAQTYGHILAAFRTGKHGKFSEHADYRIARDGAFISSSSRRS